ncbi:MAG: efflux RND transporter permease subunit [Deltaproteobacteria bacterium]|nr:efflux RND transporter permease subunit [Deltaproteobacteria bacterium]
MNICEIFIRRPVMTTLVMLALVIFGISSYRLLSVSDLPNVDFPTIVVTADLDGASPETMASSVATPLERQFSTIAGIDSMTSTSALGRTSITLQFSLDRDIDAAAQDVQSMISRAQRRLPDDMTNLPSLRKANPADQPVLVIAVSSPTLPLYVVNEYADTLVAQRISMINGVAQVQVFGAQKYAVRAQLDPRELISRQIGLDEVQEALKAGNINLPTGKLEGKQRSFTIRASGQLYTAEAYRPLIVAYRNGHPVRREALGRVIDSVENLKTANWFNDQRGIQLAIDRQPGTNTVELVDRIRELLPQLREQIPASIRLDTLYDRSVSIRDSINEIKFTFLLSIVLVVLVIFIFLRDISATVIPSLALPISIVITFVVMYLCHYSIDNFSLLAIILAVGFVVDDAIVVLENIVRHMEQGATPWQAALDGSKEIGFTILSMTLSLVAVFIPVLLMRGILGRLLTEFAVTISVAILASGFVSLSLTPMLCSRFMRPVTEKKHGRLYQLSERFFDSMLHLYAVSLRWVMRHPRSALTVTALSLLATIWMFAVIPKGFLPSEDIGFLSAFTETRQGISFEALKENQQIIARIIGNDPAVEGYLSTVGPTYASPANNTGRLNIKLKEREKRDLKADGVLRRLRAKCAGIPGIRIFLQNPPPVRIGGRATKSLYQFTMKSTNTDELYQHAVTMERSLASLPMLMDVTSDLQLTDPQLHVVIDRDRAAALQLSAEKIEQALEAAYSSKHVSTIYAPNNDYRVILELDPAYQDDPSALSLLYVRSGNGKLIPLSEVADLQTTVGPLTINHSEQYPSVTISFNLRAGTALSEAVDAIERIAREQLPPSIVTGFQGTAQAFQASFRGLWLLLLLAIFVIYVVLGILYESFIHPLTILSGLPSAGFGALATLMLFSMELNIYGFVGIIMLIGIVKKNAIMMIDFALEAQRREGKSSADAIFEGCLVRFRPIMMTTMAAFMGILPIALGMGAGADARRTLGMAVAGGLLFSQLLTLYITPVFYLFMENVQKWLRGKFSGTRE